MYQRTVHVKWNHTYLNPVSTTSVFSFARPLIPSRLRLKLFGAQRVLKHHVAGVQEDRSREKGQRK